MSEKRGEAEDSIANKLILKRAVDVKVRQMKAKAFISEREAYDLIRGFLKKYLGIDYEFTCDELLKELRRIYVTPDIQEDFKKLLDKLSEIEHLSRDFSKEEIETLLSEFQALVDKLIISHYDSHSFFRKLLDGLHRLFSTKHRKVFEDKDFLSENESIVVKMNMLIDNAKRLSDRDIEKAKEEYKKLNELYNLLDDAKKKAYFKAVHELYTMIKNKE